MPFENAEEVFTQSIRGLPNKLHSIPDGETGIRKDFTTWQKFVFPPDMLKTRDPTLGGTASKSTIEDIKPTRYDEVAIDSYKTLRKLKDEGIVPQNIRFQASIPTPSNACFYVDDAYIEHVEPLYRERLIQDLKNLQHSIPPADLAIQFDAAVEFAFMEYERGRITDSTWRPPFPNAKSHFLESLQGLCAAIDERVRLGVHLCYGDISHQHFVQPLDTGLLVEVARDIMEKVAPVHTIDFIHIPVPKDRTDRAYFEPLRNLKLTDTKLILGLVHAHDEEGTRKRIKAAQAVYPHAFGVATECGMGRTPREEIDSIFAISRAVTEQKAS